ncbi:MAG TPA: rhomboid family intramembrane serine protease [Longimicrobiales bacterium]|nr:rhomboid family intramembrane serine protease [Longimicrobiales bacterium]
MTPWVKILLIANVAMFGAQWAYPPLVGDLMLVPALILSRPWTAVTYMFLHGGVLHLLFNMLALFFFGPRLEVRLGSRDFVRLYIVSGLGGAAFSFIFAPNVGVIGASGAVFGILLAFARFWPREPIYIWGVLPVPARVLVIAFAAISIYAGISGAQAGIAHFAHLGGFAGGYAYLKWRERGARRWRAAAGPIEPSAVERIAREIINDTRRWDTIRLEDLHEINREEVERIRRKIQQFGAASLSASERAFMDRMSPG